MLFNIFSKEERYQRKLVRLTKSLCKVFNPDLILGLEKGKNHQAEIYFAIKGVFEDYISERMPKFYKEYSEILARIGVVQSIKVLKGMSEDDPFTTFCLLVGVYARLLTEEEFRRFFRCFLGFPPEVIDMVIFKNPSIDLQFRQD
jgi:hypothetical protein